MRSRHAVACVALALAVSGCAGDAQRAGTDAAAASANAITFHLRSYVVRPGATPAAQFARVKKWLVSASASASAPVSASSPDLFGLGSPTFRVLTQTGSRVDIVVYEYGRTDAIEDKDGAWGHVCSCYNIEASSRLVAQTVTCPSGLPKQPD